MKKSISIPARIVIALLLAALAVGCALAASPAKTPGPAPEPTPTPIPTSELQPAADFSGLLRDENVSFTLRSETLSLAAIRENAARLRAKREAGEKVNKAGDYIEALLVNMTVRNDTGKELVLCRPELETLRDGVWYRLEYETRRKTDELEGPLRANAVARGAIPLADLDGGYLVPGEYRVCIPYYLGAAQGEADHVAVAEFVLAEALEPQSLAETVDLDPDKYEKLVFSGPLGLHTLHKGEEGFTQVLEFLGSLRGSPSYTPHSNVHCSVRLEKDVGHDFLAMDYDGKRVIAALNEFEFLALETDGRPDLELEALFARYAKAPDPVPYDPGKYVVDGLLSLAPARSVIEHDALQEAIDVSLRRYTEPRPVGESVAAEEGAILRMTAKNEGEKTIYYDPPLSILALRDGEWYWVRLRYDFASDLILRSLSPGATAECAVSLDLFDDPLEPGQYCVCMFYTVTEMGKSPYDHVAFAPFVITDGEPLPAPEPTPEPTPAPTPEPDDGTELLMGTVKREKIKSVEYTLSAYDDYLLERGDEGFERIMDKLWSLRGVPCEEPASRLVARGFDFNSHMVRISLVFDGERVYGSMFQNQWLLLDAEGRPDQELTELFWRWGRDLAPPPRLDTSPSKLGGMIEDGSLVMATEFPGYDPKPLFSAYARYIEQYRISGMEQDIRTQDLCIGIRLENHTDTSIHHDGEFELEAFRDGEWRLISRRFSYIGVEYGLNPWEQQSEWVFPIVSYDEEALTPGRYRICLPYRVGDGKGHDHAAFAEFELTDGAPAPTPAPTPTPTPYVPVTIGQGRDWLTLPEGTRWLTEEELAEWQAWFEADWMRPQFLNSAYVKQSEVDLGELFYVGVDTREETREAYNAAEVHPITEEDIRSHLFHLGYWETECPVDKLPRAEMDALLRKYLGGGLDSTSRIGLSWFYLPETDAYYHAHGDTNVRGIRLLYGTVRENSSSEYTKRWVDLYYGGGAVWRVRLVVHEYGVYFVSNLRVLSDGTDFICQTPQPGTSYPADYSGDYGRDVTVLTLTPEIFESYEAALAATDAICAKEVSEHGGEKTETVVDTFHRLREQECPGYGTLIYGEVATAHGPLSHLFFITTDGKRYRIEEPQGVLLPYPMTEDWSAAEEGRGYFMKGADAGMLRWWMNCPDPTGVGGGEMRQGGAAEWTLYLPTMEVFVLFTPEE